MRRRAREKSRLSWHSCVTAQRAWSDCAVPCPVWAAVSVREDRVKRKLEMDRRLIHERIGQLKSELEDVKRHREVTRKQRDRKYTLSAAIVGYTNAGKSTLLNT